VGKCALVSWINGGDGFSLWSEVRIKSCLPQERYFGLRIVWQTDAGLCGGDGEVAGSPVSGLPTFAEAMAGAAG
jgi:hypothetical protein